MLHNIKLTTDHLETAIILLDEQTRCVYMNQSAEQLFDISHNNLFRCPVSQIFQQGDALFAAMHQAATHNARCIEHELTVIASHSHEKLHLRVSVSPLLFEGQQHLLLEFQPIDRSLKLAREAQMMDQTQANRLLLRNLAHEIKNPLGGIRGAAQLLEQELNNPSLYEYTQVIVQEADRLKSLMEKLLSPRQHSTGHTPLNIHEVLERVRSVVNAEMSAQLQIIRDYDASLPDLIGDKEQLIQVVMNIVRNAAQAMKGQGKIKLKTRVARQVTIKKQLYRLAALVKISDNGPGIPQELQDKIFYPLVSGRAEGHGLGLTLAQDYINQHNGCIEFDSEPGKTCFTITLPIP